MEHALHSIYDITFTLAQVTGAQTGSRGLLDRIVESPNFSMLAITGAITLIVLFKTACSTLTNNARERTKREIAAFIAEGTMTPEQGERILKAGQHDRA